ncbi:MAG: 23S rRNA (adenine(2030)-N(6))-methyltransferase RlmJ [Hyphomicrobium denitrificans]|nr:23S rRNA (adenine(2030)-N(6))-methyltransferase RlmJ [Hyphomicrobium denitrificans]
MNYRHGYHAGNFADVVKHVVLARVLTYMKQKPRPFRVIDTHAGAGRYDLAGVEAGKTGEWQDGIGRVFNAEFAPPVAELLQHTGSSLIASRIMRPEDVLVANELSASEFERLKRELGRTRNTTFLNIDAWHAVKSLLPPKERRAVILIDPPFEAKSEFADLVVGVREAMSRFQDGVYLIWYPLKDVEAADRFVAEATSRPGLEFLDVRLAVCAPFPGLGLTATGVLVINPPYLLRGELETVLPALRDCMAEGEGCGFVLKGVVQ